MADIVAWGTKFPEWSAPVVNSLARLDALQARNFMEEDDGLYLGVDLKDMAKLYVKKFSTHDVGFDRLINSTRALHFFGASFKNEEAMVSADALSSAMLKGAQALLKGVEPKYESNEIFSKRFIGVEFDLHFKEVYRELPKYAQDGGWKNYWQKWLGGCWTDMFLNSRSCPFDSR